MVRSRRVYSCENCRRDYMDYDIARSCEIKHITDAAASSFRADMDRIFGRPATRKDEK